MNKVCNMSKIKTSTTMSKILERKIRTQSNNENLEKKYTKQRKMFK